MNHFSPDQCERIITIGGGKGGVGKSIVSANLAVHLARRGIRVALVDADLGAANLHSLLGIRHAGATLHDFVDGRVTSLSDLLRGTPWPSLQLIVGSYGLAAPPDLAPAPLARLLDALPTLPADVVIVDIGAGTSAWLIDTFLAGDLGLVVVNPELSALQNAYSFLKLAVYQSIRRHRTAIGLPAGHELLSGDATARLSQKLSALTVTDPAVGRALSDHLAGFRAAMVGNRIMHPREESAVLGAARMAEDFLTTRVPVLAHLPESRALFRAVRRGQPGLWGSEGMGALERLTQAILSYEGRAFPGPSADDDNAAVDAPAPTPTAERRRAPRSSVDYSVQLATGRTVFPGRMLDISDCGALLECQVPLRPDDDLSIRRHTARGVQSVRATVRRYRRKHPFHLYGVEFLTPGRWAGVFSDV